MMLDHLDEIRMGLLLGTIPMARLEQLAQLVRAKREQIDDPKLLAILDDIELRAAVELAKLEQLAQLVRVKREQIEDPKLLAILDEIELRAAVELAKLSRPAL